MKRKKNTSSLLRWGGPICVALLCLVAFERESAYYRQRLEELSLQRKLLEREISLLNEEKGLLLREVYSQSDPRWIEMTLLKVLGMAAEGDTKILFLEKTGAKEGKS